jgi:hypothetical protein
VNFRQAIDGFYESYERDIVSKYYFWTTY